MNRDHRRSSHPPTVTSSPGVCLREDSPYLQTTTTTFLSTTTTITFTAITKPQSPPRFSQKLFQLSNSSLKPLFYPRTHTRTHAHVSCRRWPILFKSYTRARVSLGVGAGSEGRKRGSTTVRGGNGIEGGGES